MPSPTIRKSQEGLTVAIVGDVYRFLVTGDETNGRYAVFEAIVPPGGGPPPHIHHREEEGFYVLEGEVTIRVGEQQIVAQAGMFANLPVGIPHSFRNEGSRVAKMLVTVVPAGLEKMFLEVGTRLPPGTTTALPPTSADIQKLLAAAPNYDIEIVAPH